MKKPGWNLLWPWIEAAVSVVVGLLFYFPLHKPDLAEIAWIFGFLLAFAGLATTVRLRQELRAVRKLSEILDLSESCDVERIGEILRLYVVIKEDELRPIKEDVIDNSISQLVKLAYDKVSDEIRGSEYYLWLIRTMDECRKGEHIYAVNTMMESAWNEILPESQFLDKNIEAVKKGAIIDRIFISSRDGLRDKRNRRVIQQHIENAKNGLTAFVGFSDEIGAQDPQLISELGEGFILFGERVILIDTSVPPEEARGRVSMNLTHIKHYGRLFERLRLHVKVADSSLFEELDRVSEERGPA